MWKPLSRPSRNLCAWSSACAVGVSRTWGESFPPRWTGVVWWEWNFVIVLSLCFILTQNLKSKLPQQTLDDVSETFCLVVPAFVSRVVVVLVGVSNSGFGVLVHFDVTG